MKNKKRLIDINLKDTNKEEIRQALLVFKSNMERRCEEQDSYFPSMFFTLEDEYCSKPTFRRCEMNSNNAWFGFISGRLVEFQKDGFYEVSIKDLTDNLWSVIERDYKMEDMAEQQIAL